MNLLTKLFAPWILIVVGDRWAGFGRYWKRRSAINGAKLSAGKRGYLFHKFSWKLFGVKVFGRKGFGETFDYMIIDEAARFGAEQYASLKKQGFAEFKLRVMPVVIDEENLKDAKGDNA